MLRTEEKKLASFGEPKMAACLCPPEGDIIHWRRLGVAGQNCAQQDAGFYKWSASAPACILGVVQL